MGQAKLLRIELRGKEFLDKGESSGFSAELTVADAGKTLPRAVIPGIEDRYFRARRVHVIFSQPPGLDPTPDPDTPKLLNCWRLLAWRPGRKLPLFSPTGSR